MTIKSLLAYPYYRLFGYRPFRVSVDAWNRQFGAGDWEYLNGIDQIGCLSIVFSYCELLAPDAILDVGCGSGSLTKTLRLLNYRHYLGIDVSAEAIAQAASAYADDRTDFAVADAESYVPSRCFDMIVFNNIAYYFDKPDRVIARYAKFLNPTGRVVVAMTDDGRTRAAWSLIEKRMAVEHAIRVVQADGGATTKLLSPRHGARAG